MPCEVARVLAAARARGAADWERAHTRDTTRTDAVECALSHRPTARRPSADGPAGRFRRRSTYSPYLQNSTSHNGCMSRIAHRGIAACRRMVMWLIFVKHENKPYSILYSFVHCCACPHTVRTESRLVDGDTRCMTRAPRSPDCSAVAPRVHYDSDTGRESRKLS